MIECGPSIVLTVVPKLRAHVSEFTTLHWHEGFKVSYLNKEWKNAIPFAIDNKLREHDGMGAMKTQITWPPLGCLWSWSIDNELISLSIEGSCCL
jgi:hypothetical protein